MSETLGNNAQEKRKTALEKANRTGTLASIGLTGFGMAAITYVAAPVIMFGSEFVYGGYVAAVAALTGLAATQAIVYRNKCELKAIEKATNEDAGQTLSAVPVKSEALSVLPQKELDAIKPENTPEPQQTEEKRNWRQRIQTAELNEAAQRSIH